jgi:hypothetical protein
LTTFFSYGQVSNHRQTEIIQNLGLAMDAPKSHADEVAEAVVRRLLESGSRHRSH